MAGNDSSPAYLLAAAGTLIALGVTFVTLLFVTRFVQKTKYGVDDYLLLPSLLMVIGCCAVIIYGVDTKTLAHSSVKGSPTYKYYNHGTLQKLEMAFFLMHVFGMGCIKLSFVFFYRRIFVAGKPRSTFGIVSMGMIVVIILWTLGFVLLFFTNCGTHLSERFKSLADTRKYCPTGVIDNEAMAIADFITDFMVYALPIPVVIRLHMSTNRKLAVLGVFGIGSMAIVASIIRMAQFVNFVAIASGKKKIAVVDEELLVTAGIYWSILEAGIALISCCLPRLNLFSSVPSIRTAINSVWSLVKIDSFRSRSSKNRSSRTNRSDKNYIKTDDESVTAPHAELVPDKGNKVNIQAYAMGDLENQNKMNNGNIWVDKTVYQQETMSSV